MSVNTFHKFLWHEFILVELSNNQHMSKVDLHLLGVLE